MKMIPLTQGKYALVDDADFTALNQYKWFAEKTKWTWYASRNLKDSKGKKRLLRMHRDITGAKKGQFIDHWDGNGLNCQRNNLRVTNRIGNSANMKRSRRNKTGFKGVNLFKSSGKWRATCANIHIGLFTDIQEAARAYDKFAFKKWGTFAKLNFPNDCGMPTKCMAVPSNNR